MQLLRKPWLLVTLMNVCWLLAIDQINHWSSPLQLHLLPFWIPILYPALYFPLARGFLVTFLTGLFAASYAVAADQPFLLLMGLLHICLFITRKNFQNHSRIPPLFLIGIVTLAGFLAMLPFTPPPVLLQPAFWVRFWIDLLYNLLIISLLSLPFYRLHGFLLNRVEERK